MHTLQLKIDDSIFTKFMGLLEILPKGKISVIDDSNAISFDEAKLKVQRAINNVSDESGLTIDKAFDKVLNS